MELTKKQEEIITALVGYTADIKVNLAAGNALTAFYLALILKKLSGIEITADIEESVRNDVVQKYEDLLNRYYEAEEFLSRGPRH